MSDRDDESTYAQVEQLIRQIIDNVKSNEAATLILPGAVARAAFDHERDGFAIPMTIEWTSIEHFKQIARSELRGKYGHASNTNPVYQNDMFSGHLQDFYPVRSVDGEGYKRRDLMTNNEIDQNLRALKKQSDARLRHYDALLAFKLGRTKQA